MALKKSGCVLQDLVNEFGRRLDYNVLNGLYSGKQNSIGFDGIWKTDHSGALVIEVKTTDAYRINLDTIAKYREKLIASGDIDENSSILIIVGRNDTGDLEAQVRGSKHAWDIRLISVDSLIKLVSLKEETESNTVERIRELLKPFEYTRVDKIIDIAFTAAQEYGESNTELPENHIEHDENRKTITTKSEIRDRIIKEISSLNKIELIKKSAATYWSADQSHSIRAACTISKRYDGSDSYWYAYHPSWDKFLSDAKIGYYTLGCIDKRSAFVIPVKWIKDRLPELHVTEKENGDMHWHIFLSEKDGKLFFKAYKSGKLYDISEFKINF